MFVVLINFVKIRTLQGYKKILRLRIFIWCMNNLRGMYRLIFKLFDRTNNF